jgi:osmotically inducible protein OsmC
MKRNATAVWNGTGKEGNGTVTTQSNTLDNTQFSYLSRFENGTGTNPDELVAAAHASCFSMKLAFVLNAAGFTASKIETRCDITLDQGSITESHLNVKATIPDISEEDFNKSLTEAKDNCTISKLFNTNITHEAVLG